MNNITPKTLKGFRDFLPKEEVKRQFVIDKIKMAFESFGFEPLETPAIEYEEILLGKYGEEGDKLLYRFQDRGERKVALRYDQTVPLARVVAQYGSASSPQVLPLPFKRYQIQPVWRAENPQKGRFREFLQCDADIVGSSTPLSDAEVIALASKTLESLGFTKFKILINDRKAFFDLIEKGAFTKEEMAVIVRIIDKIKKIGKDGVIKELAEKGYAPSKGEEIIKLIEEQEKTDTLKDINSYLENMQLKKDLFEFSPTLARGLDYYTGMIFEIEIEGYTAGSVCGGGRYDNLIGMFADKNIPAVGFAFGFDRLVEAMEEFNLFPKDLGITKVLATVFSDALKEKSIEISSRLRSNNINTEIYLGEVKEKNALEKQLKYANQKAIPYAVIIGPNEAEKNVVILRNMETREQKDVTLEELIKEIKE
ncbi:histidine--tRNA ligase [Candidatus Microgenomates bacterium]|nr:MAG: histidine--tRNA ligase [Candidatus Microgenomates bacterium]